MNSAQVPQTGHPRIFHKHLAFQTDSARTRLRRRTSSSSDHILRRPPLNVVAARGRAAPLHPAALVDTEYDHGVKTPRLETYITEQCLGPGDCRDATTAVHRMAWGMISRRIYFGCLYRAPSFQPVPGASIHIRGMRTGSSFCTAHLALAPLPPPPCLNSP